MGEIFNFFKINIKDTFTKALKKYFYCFQKQLLGLTDFFQLEESKRRNKFERERRKKHRKIK